MEKVCVFLADGFEEIEALTVVDMLRRANEEVVMELSAVLYEYSEPEAMTYMTSPAGFISHDFTKDYS